ncbi:MAG TPA: hypothetical protein VFJ56_06705, partial [Nitrospira sp.]|nr:hypothetical protein [Nitrospira sp.]
PHKAELYPCRIQPLNVARPAVSVNRSFKQVAGVFPPSQPCGDSAESQKRVCMGGAVGNFREERQSITQVDGGGFSPALPLENRTDLRQGSRFAPPLFGCPKGLERLLIVGKGFGKMVLDVVDFADAKQLVTVQFPS